MYFTFILSSRHSLQRIYLIGILGKFVVFLKITTICNALSTMKKAIIISLLSGIVFLAGCTDPGKKVSKFDFTGPKDASLIRGFNYTPANVAAPRHHVDTWVHYDSATIKFDLDLAKSLNMNQVRVFVPYAVYTEDKVALPSKLRHFIRECHKRNIGVMPVVGSGPWLRDSTLRDQAREWVKFLVDSISNEPGLAMWDAMNEPDWPTSPKEMVDRKYQNAILWLRPSANSIKIPPLPLVGLLSMA